MILYFPDITEVEAPPGGNISTLSFVFLEIIPGHLAQRQSFQLFYNYLNLPMPKIVDCFINRAMTDIKVHEQFWDKFVMKEKHFMTS